jgi:anion-transporting  ArsA/GET3 family ATPase
MKERMSSPDLRSLVERAPLVTCLGPGGVGKTTISAVLALHGAATRRRSLVLTIDPARRLADALNLPELTNDPIEISSFHKMHPGGTLSALMLDPTATFDHMVAMLVPDAERRQSLLANRYYQHMSRTLAGTLEYMAVERLYALTSSNDYDVVVLDTPPTSNALDFLDAPDRLASFFSEKVMRWFLPSESSSWTARLIDRAGARALGLIGKVAGEEFVRDTVGFFAAFKDLLSSFQQRGERIGALMRDPAAVFLIICGPDATRVEEAKTIDLRLREAGCRARGFIINRVDTPFLPQEIDAAETMGRATELLGGSAERERVEAFISRLESLRRARDVSAGQHAEAVAALRAHAGDRPVFTAPRVPPGSSARAALLAIYVGLFADGS